MPLKNRFLLISLLALVVVVLAILFTPFAVSNGIRLWVWWAARQQGFVATIDKIDAPLLGPVVIRRLHLKNARDNALRIDVTAADARVSLNLKHVLLHMPGRVIHNLSLRELRVELHRANPTVRAITPRGWTALQRLLPENLTIAKSEVRVENGPTLILLRNGLLQASESEAGRFSADEVMIASPWLRQTFSQLRGATHWEGNRLTLAGLNLSRGLDLQSATADLSRLRKQRVGLQFDLDAFGGKIRGNISHEWRSRQFNWKVAGACTDISLAQTSDAFGFTNRVTGLLHAANFTFHGNLAQPDRVTASLWGELTALTWRDRTAEAIMLGAALYNRKIQLQQLYIKQRTNQFTLSGEAALAANSAGWLNPDFRGNISASINQLGDFAALFGANPEDFAGKITIEGTMDTRDRKFGGRLAAEGASLTLFKANIDSFSARLNLKPPELQIEQLELKRKNDALSGRGSIETSGEHKYSGTLEARIDNLLDYISAARGSAAKHTTAIPVELQATIDSGNWDAWGVINVPQSSPMTFTANFPLPIGTDWNALQSSPVNMTLDFPSILLPNAAQLFGSEVLQDGILTGRISVSGMLQHPRVLGDVQLLNAKLSGAGWTWFDPLVASSHTVFEGNRASVEFLNLATKDVDLSVRGEIDFQDTNSVRIKIGGATPIFDLTSYEIDCVTKIEIAPTVLTLAPAVAELELRGPLFQSGWTITLKEDSTQSLGIVMPSSGARTFSVCPGTPLTGKTLLLGSLPRPEAARPKRQAKGR
jgi:hypothetical protein